MGTSKRSVYDTSNPFEEWEAEMKSSVNGNEKAPAKPAGKNVPAVPAADNPFVTFYQKKNAGSGGTPLSNGTEPGSPLSSSLDAPLPENKYGFDPLENVTTPAAEETPLPVPPVIKPVKTAPLSANKYGFNPLENVTTPAAEETPLPVPPVIKPGKTAPVPNDFVYDKSPFNDDLGQPVIEQDNGSKLSINPKTIPITPYGNSKTYISDLQGRIKTGKVTRQDELFLQTNQKNNQNFNESDTETLSGFSTKYNLPVLPADTEGRLAGIKTFKNKILQDQADADAKTQSSGGTAGVPVIITDYGKPKGQRATEFDQLDELEKKLSWQKSKTDIVPLVMTAAVREDNSGNLLTKLVNRVLLFSPNTNAQGQAGIALENIDTRQKLAPEFSYGLNGLKYTEPAQYERVKRALQTGQPLSESMVANITAQGLEAKEAVVKDQYVNKELTKAQYQKETGNIQKSRYENLVGNPETLRAFLSSGIANTADDINMAKSGTTDPNTFIGEKIFGHKWNYSDDEIARYGKAYAQANGIDPDDARVKGAIQYLQDNEGAMIMSNSIAKAGWARDFAKGLASPIRGISNFAEDVVKTKADVYAEGQSQGNINVAEQKLSRIENSWEGTVSDIMEGTGQFVTQAGLAAVTSSVLGAAGNALLGRAGVAALQGDIALGDMAGKDIVGKMLLNSKDGISTYITSYAQVYDQNLKQALNYTSDDKKALISANIASITEGATEMFLSPLDIAKGIAGKIFNRKELTRGLIDIIGDAAVVNKNTAIKNFLKASLQAGLETTKVLASEMGEEEVSQIVDYATNAVLNPKSKSFQDRDLMQELGNTAYQTGLSMIVPALISGAGAFNVNSFSKGSLIIAAQNRQQMLADMDMRLHSGNMTQAEYNEKAAIINTAAKANDLLPNKENGEKLNSQEKANYIYSRVSEAILNKKLAESEDEAVKSIIKDKIKKQQEFRVSLLASISSPNINSNGKTENSGSDASQKNSTSENGQTGEGSADGQTIPDDATQGAANDGTGNGGVLNQNDAAGKRAASLLQIANDRAADMQEIDDKIANVSPDDMLYDEKKATLIASKKGINEYYNNLEQNVPAAATTGISHADWLLKNKDLFPEKDFTRITEGLASADETIKAAAIAEIVAKKQAVKPALVKPQNPRLLAPVVIAPEPPAIEPSTVKSADAPLPVSGVGGDVKKGNIFTRKDLPNAVGNVPDWLKTTNVDAIESKLNKGDKITFFAEKERSGIWDGKMIVDEKGTKWGTLGILSDKDGFIRNESAIERQSLPTPPKADVVVDKGVVYPLEDKSKWQSMGDKKNEGELRYITPDDFLSKAKGLEMNQSDRDNIDKLKQHILDGKKLDPLEIYSEVKNSLGSNIDGRHRAMAAKELGIKEVPVIDYSKDQSLPTPVQNKEAGALPVTPEEIQAEKLRKIRENRQAPEPQAPKPAKAPTPVKEESTSPAKPGRNETGPPKLSDDAFISEVMAGTNESTREAFKKTTADTLITQAKNVLRTIKKSNTQLTGEQIDQNLYDAPVTKVLSSGVVSVQHRLAKIWEDATGERKPDAYTKTAREFSEATGVDFVKGTKVAKSSAAVNKEETVKKEVQSVSGQEVNFEDREGKMVTGEKITVPDVDIDLVLVRNGFKVEVYELASARQMVGLTGLLGKQEIINYAAARIQKTDGRNKLFQQMYRDETAVSMSGIEQIKVINSSPAYENYRSQQKAIFDNLPFVFTDKEKEQLRAFKATADAAGLTGVSSQMTWLINTRKQEKYVGQSNIASAKRMLDNALKAQQLDKLQQQQKHWPAEDIEPIDATFNNFKKTVLITYKSENQFDKVPQAMQQAAADVWIKVNEIRNQYGYLPDFLKPSGVNEPDNNRDVAIDVARYIVAVNSSLKKQSSTQKAARIKQAEQRVYKTIANLNAILQDKNVSNEKTETEVEQLAVIAAVQGQIKNAANNQDETKAAKAIIAIDNILNAAENNILTEQQVIDGFKKLPPKNELDADPEIELTPAGFPVSFSAIQQDDKIVYYVIVGRQDPINFLSYKAAEDYFDKALVQFNEKDLKDINDADVKRHSRKNAADIFPEPDNRRILTTELKEKIPQKEADTVVQSWKDHAIEIGKAEDHSNEVIISLFDASGTWSKPYKEAGYNVIRYDLSRGDDIMQMDWVYLRSQIELSGKKVVGVLSAPPCTSFAGSGARWWGAQHDNVSKEWVKKKYGEFAAELYDKPLEYAVDIINMVQFGVEMLDPSLFHVIENPVGRIQEKASLPNPSITFNPNHFGDPYTKKTMLWGVMNTSLPTANVDPVEGSKVQSKISSGDPARSQTPEGFAYAFFVANNTSKIKFNGKINTEARDTEAIISSAEAIISQAEIATEEKEIDVAAEKIEAVINEIESKIGKLKASYSTKGIYADYPSSVIGKLVKKEITSYAKGIAKQLGWDIAAKDIHPNIAPAGGEVSFTFTIPGTPYSMYVQASYQPEYSDNGGYDNYNFNGFFYRLEESGASGNEKYKGGNQWQKENVTAAEMAQILKREASGYLAKLKVKPARKSLSNLPGALEQLSAKTRVFLMHLNEYPETFSGNEEKDGGVEFLFYNPSTKNETKYFVPGDAPKMIDAVYNYLRDVEGVMTAGKAVTPSAPELSGEESIVNKGVLKNISIYDVDENKKGASFRQTWYKGDTAHISGVPYFVTGVETEVKGKKEVVSLTLTPNPITDNAKAIIDILPKGGELNGVTVVEVSNDGETIHYGTKASTTRLTVERLTAKEILAEIKDEEQILHKSKIDATNFNEAEVWAGKASTREEKLLTLKMHKQSVANNEQVEKIVLPFYEKQLEFKAAAESLAAKKAKPLSEIPAQAPAAPKPAEPAAKVPTTLKQNGTTYTYNTTDSKGNHLYNAKGGLDATYPYIIIAASGSSNSKVRLDNEFPELLPFGFATPAAAAGQTGKDYTDRPSQAPAAVTKRNIRVATQTIRTEAGQNKINGLIAKFIKGGNNLTSGGLDSERIEAGVDLVAEYIKQGVYKFSNMVINFYSEVGDVAEDYFAAMKSVYSTYREGDATPEEFAQMDGSLRNFTFDNIIYENADTGTGTANTPQLDEAAGKLAPGKSQSTVQGNEGQGRTDGLGNQQGTSLTERDRADEVGRPPFEPGTGTGEGQPVITVTGNEALNNELGGESVPQEIPAPAEQKPVITPLQHNGNFVIPPDYTNSKSFNVSQKLQSNIDALQVLVNLNNEQRKATYEEQKILFQYVGWGGIKEIGFDTASNNGWVASNEGLKPKIRQVLTLLKELDEKNYETNLDGIKSSVLNAHYTAIPVIRGVYNVIRKAGFKGGRVIEPSAGIGHFIGAMPIDMLEKSQVAALEKDSITAMVLKNLYPNSLTKNIGYEKIGIGVNSVDLTISNIPFGNYSIFDPNFDSGKDKVLKASQKKIHAYFFARAINDAKPNGLIAFITSTGILDAKDNADLRKMMADRTEFLGAMRLPNDAFKGNANTSVTTDIIFLRKFTPSEEITQKHNFLKLKQEIVKHKNKNSEQQLEVSYNEYFHDNPDMILGKVEAGSMYGKSKDGLTDTMTVTPDGIDLETRITELAGKIAGEGIRDNTEEEKVKAATLDYVKNEGQRPGNIIKLGDGEYGIFTDDDAIDEALDAKAREIGLNPNDIRTDNLFERDYDTLAANGLSAKDFKIKKVNRIRIPKKYAGAVVDLLPLREALNKLYAAEYGDMGDDFIEGKRRDLNTTYKTFVKNNGTLFDNKVLLDIDTDGHNLLALENVTDKKVTGLADIFTKRVFEKQKRAESAEDISDAISLNLSETGSIDINRITELLKITPEEAVKAGEGIMFKNPMGDFETTDKYLSGDVRKKLEEARVAAQADASYQKNVVALEAAQPVDLNASQIYAPISAPWIATKYLEQFSSQLLKQNILINRLSTGRVNVNGRVQNTEVTDVFGTPRRDAFVLLEEALQNRMPVVTDTIDKKVVVNAEETQKAVEKVNKIKKAFDSWIWQDDERRNDLAAHYNRTYNNVILRKYDGSHLKFEGYAGIHNPMPHQKDGVWMITQQMGGILDHIVGSGKSLLMALAANKMKKMGLIKKPIIIGLKANASDLAKAYKDSFPLSKVLYPRAKDFTPENRKAFFATMANNDWDAIVMTHDQFGMIGQSQEVQQEIIGEEIEALENDIRAAKDNNMSKRDLNGLEVRKQNLQSKLSALSSMKKDPSLKSFEEMGIDFMFVDESQQFKNLQYSTIQKGVSGLGDPLGSAKAFNMLFAIRTLQKRWGGDKGTVFASGTPISNTMVEMYLLFKYLRPNKLTEMGITSFDNWANTFASVGSEIEFGVTNSLKPKVRMREFMNVPEMAAMYREIADVRNDSNLVLKKPKFKQTYRFKTDKTIGNGEIVTIDGTKFKVIGRIKGLEKNEHYISMMSMATDVKLPKAGEIDYEGGQINYSEVTNSDGLLVNIAPTRAQSKFAKAIQKFAETKDGSWVGMPNLSDKKKKAYMLLATNLAAKMAIDMRLIDPKNPGTELGKLGVAADIITGHYKESDANKGIQLVFSDIGTPKSVNTAENLYDLLESRGVDPDTLEVIFGEGATAEKAKYPRLPELKTRIMQTLEYSEDEYNDAVIEANEDVFNIYQDMKNKLVKRGIPEHEIVFIHDYKTDAKKKQLFEDARAGKIRVIIGSTAKLGTGVNVQNKIVAMHHLDVPWRPSDMEQRNGRGIRQGNDIIRDHYGNELPIYYYATEATLDAYKYQLLDTKQRFIDQGKSGEGAAREISEGDGDEENGVSYAAMTAMLSGNPIILEKAKVDKLVKELENSARSFEQEKYSLKDKIASNIRNEKYAREDAAEYLKDKNLFEANTTRNPKTGEFVYSALIDGKTYTERVKAGEKLLELKENFLYDYEKKYPLARNTNWFNRSVLSREQKVIGKISGFDIIIEMHTSANGATSIDLEPAIGVSSPVSTKGYAFSYSKDAVNLAGHLQREVRDLQTSIEIAESRAAAYKKDANDKRQYLASLPAEFPRQKDYEAALVRQAKVDATLKAMVSSKLPTATELEEFGTRIRNAADLDINALDLQNIYALTEQGQVTKVETKVDYFEIRNEDEGTRFYEYSEQASPDEEDIPVEEAAANVSGKGKAVIGKLHPEVSTALDVVQKELNLSGIEMALYNEYRNMPAEKLAAAIEAGTTLITDQETKIENIEQELNDIDNNVDGNARKIDDVNDDDDLTAAQKAKQVKALEAEYEVYTDTQAKKEAELEAAKLLKAELEEYPWDADVITKIIDRVNTRLQTRMDVREGTDIFPAYAGIPEILFSAKNEATDFQTGDEKPVTVAALRQKYPGAAIRQSQTDLPQEVQDLAMEQGVTVEGVLYKGKVYLVADNLTSMGRAEGVYRHETIGHRGVIAVLKQKLIPFVKNLVNNAGGIQQKAINKLAQRLYQKDISQLTPAQKNILGEEYIAQAAEQPQKFPTTFEKLAAFVRSALRGLGIALAVSDKDIKVLLNRAAKQTGRNTTLIRFSAAEPTASGSLADLLKKVREQLKITAKPADGGYLSNALKKVREQAQTPAPEIPLPINDYADLMIDYVRNLFKENGQGEPTAADVIAELEPVDAAEAAVLEAYVKKQFETKTAAPAAEPASPPSGDGGGGDGTIDALTTSYPGEGEVRQYISGETIEKYTGEFPDTSQDYFYKSLNKAFQHGLDIIETAKNVYGDKYVTRLLDFIKNANKTAETKALVYISLQNDLHLRKLAEPGSHEEIISLQRLVWVDSQDNAHDVSRAMNIRKLQNLARYGYDGSTVTDPLFSPAELEKRQAMEDAVQSKEDDVNKEYEDSLNEAFEAMQEQARKDAEEAEKQKAADRKAADERKKAAVKAKVSAEKKAVLLAKMDKLKKDIDDLNCK